MEWGSGAITVVRGVSLLHLHSLISQWCGTFGDAGLGEPGPAAGDVGHERERLRRRLRLERRGGGVNGWTGVSTRIVRLGDCDGVFERGSGGGVGV